MLISSWLIHSVTRKRRTGITTAGDPSYGSTTTVAARVEFVQRKLRSAEGKEVVSTCEMAMTEEPRYDDLYWLPSIAGTTADDTASDDAGRTPLSIKGATNKIGTQRLWMIYFG